MRGIDMCLHVFSCFHVCSSPFESWYNLALIRRNSHKITQSQTFWTIFLHSKLLPVHELWLKLNQFLPLPYTQINWKAITQPHVFNGMGNYLAHDSKDVCPTSKSCPANCSNCWNNQNCQLYDTRKFRVNGKYLLPYFYRIRLIAFCVCVFVCLADRGVDWWVNSTNFSLLPFICKCECVPVLVSCLAVITLILLELQKCRL